MFEVPLLTLPPRRRRRRNIAPRNRPFPRPSLRPSPRRQSGVAKLAIPPSVHAHPADGFARHAQLGSEYGGLDGQQTAITHVGGTVHARPE